MKIHFSKLLFTYLQHVKRPNPCQEIFGSMPFSALLGPFAIEIYLGPAVRTYCVFYTILLMIKDPDVFFWKSKLKKSN